MDVHSIQEANNQAHRVKDAHILQEVHGVQLASSYWYSPNTLRTVYKPN